MKLIFDNRFHLTSANLPTDSDYGYWSATVYSSDSNRAWAVIYPGNAGRESKGDSRHFRVLCVRDL